MADLPYTAQSLRHITDRHARRGNDFMQRNIYVARETKALKNLRDTYQLQYKAAKKNPNQLTILRTQYAKNREVYHQRRDTAIDKALRGVVSDLSNQLTTDSFTWGITLGSTISNRITYRLKNQLSLRLAEKQAESILRQSVRLRRSSRKSIIQSLKDALDKSHAHAIIRLDIRTYFDTIPHTTLAELVRSNQQIDTITQQLINLFLQEFENVSGSPVGIPQGIGLSCQLAEIYLSEFDKIIRLHPSVIYYARYVDDVVIIIDQPHNAPQVHTAIATQLTRLGLAKNNSKSYQISTDSKGLYPINTALSYLGYTFSKDTKGKLITALTDEREDRRTDRINRAFELWLRKSPSKTKPNTGDDGLLVDRIRTLAGNTKLFNAKRDVTVGIFHSNSGLDQDAVQLEVFDIRLKQLILENEDLMSNQLHSKLTGISFQRGFEERTFLIFSQNRMNRISICWKGM